MCNCRLTNKLLALVILVFAIWPTQILSFVVSRWIIIIASVLIILHACLCKDGVCKPENVKPGIVEKSVVVAKKPVAKKKAKKKARKK